MLWELIFALGLSRAAPIDLGAAAAASGRPPECWPPRPSGHAAPSSVWSRARVPGLERYCALIARGQARVAADPLGARAAALEAEQILPGKAAPRVLLARAAVRLGQQEGGLEEFQRALGIDSRAVEQPLAMHELASALGRSGQLVEALKAYRKLVPRAGLLPSRRQRAQVLLEAAHTAMAAAGRGQLDGGLDEAMVFLREAARDPNHPLRIDVALSLALAQDRAGKASQADALVLELTDTGHWAQHEPADYLVDADELLALRALALQRSEPSAALALWQRYLASASTPAAYRAAARARVARLQGGAAGRRSPRRRGRRSR